MTVNIPAGLEDNNLEVYRYKNTVRAIYNGKKVNYTDLPAHLRRPFMEELTANRKAYRWLCNQIDSTDANRIEETYVACRYGALNNIPDLKKGKTTADMPICGKSETCSGYNIVCRAPCGPGGCLAKREFQVAMQIANGRLDKEIASDLGIQLPTLRTHIARIREKLHSSNRIEVALWMHKQGIN